MNSLRNVQDVWKKYRFILTASQKRWGIVVVIMTLIGAVFETLGVSVIIPLVQVIMNPEMLLDNPYSASVIHALHLESRAQMIMASGVAVILVYMGKNAFLFFLSYVRAKYACKVQRELSVEMMKSYLGRGYSFFLNSNTGTLLRGMTNSINGTYEALYQIFKIMAEIFTVACICVYILMMDAMLAFWVIGLAALCLLCVAFGFRKWMKKCGNLEYTLNAAINKILLQAFQGVKEVLVMNKQHYFVEKYEEKYIRRQYAVIGKTVAGESPSYLIEAVCVMGLIIAVCMKAMGTQDVAMLVSQLASFAVGAFRILPSLGRITNSFNQVMFFMPSLEDTYQNFKSVRKASAETKEMDRITESEERRFQEKIEVKNVTWKYDGSEKEVLNDVSLVIEKGQSVAFIGQSGAGKTTLADIMLGLLVPANGKIVMDGQYDIHQMRAAWSRIIAFVPQTVYLMDDTIRNNVAFGMDAEENDEKQVWEALDQAQLKAFVEELPEGLDTLIGERGVRFSGGQRQRIAIARALYTNPDILVLDEATSALDNETENAVMEAIERLQGKKTLITIAHRLTTVRKCDILYEVKDGKVRQIDKEAFWSGEADEGKSQNINRYTNL